MKRFAFVLTSLLVLSFGFAYGQDASVSVDHIDGLYDNGGTMVIRSGVPVVYHIRFTNNYSEITGSTNGFRLYSPDGANWMVPVGTHTGAITSEMFDGGVFVNVADLDGIDSDTLGIGGFALSKLGFPTGFDEIVMTIETSVDAAYAGQTLCLDSAFYEPGGLWLWSNSPDVEPTWDGPHCYEVFEVPNLAPEFTNCPTIGAVDHCAIAVATFTAVDPDEEPSNPVTYSLVSGPGMIDALSGAWSYQPSLADVGPFTVVVSACDALQECTAVADYCTANGTVTNLAPVFTNCPVALIPVGKGNTVSYTLMGDDVDCDPSSFTLDDVSPMPVGNLYLVGGEVIFETDANDATDAAGTHYFATVSITDGDLSNTCVVEFHVLFTEPFGVQIEKTHMSFQGGHELVDITLNSGSEAMGGFNFLVAYDASALSFVGALEGDIYAECGWEYFTYRYGADGNCNGGCPSGLLRVVGIAETNNGMNHPLCFMADQPFTFATLDFLVTDDRTLECQYVPIRFFWLDCGDNTISSKTGDSLFISRFVYDYMDYVGDITGESSYPTYQGAQGADCFVGNENKVPVRFIDFINGGVDIACADSIDARGDINLNELGYEIADAVLFSNYFVYGISVFDINLQGQIAATDVNADGLALSVADLVYLIRVVVGDAQPYPKLNPEFVTYSVDNGTLRVNSELGAASIVVAGNTVPTLLADNMEMMYNFDGNNTRILVYSTEEGAKFSNDFISVNGEIVSVEMATYDGAPVAAKVIPANYSLKQNYPNPFNPATNISFDMSKSGDYMLTIYNVTGQKVASFSDHADAGSVSIEWDASQMASGIYFYKLNADNFSDTKKMVLLK